MAQKKMNKKPPEKFGKEFIQPLWRMKQFHELYGNYEKLSTVLRELPWSSHLHIMSKTRTAEERNFYLHIAIQEQYSVRELERAIDSGLFEKRKG